MVKSTGNGWIINALLAVILALLAGIYLHNASSAYAAGGGWETNGVMAISANQGENLILINTDPNDKTAGQTIMVYRTTGPGKFRLITARSYKYDVELTDTAANLAAEQKYEKGATFKDVFDDYQNKDKIK